MRSIFLQAHAMSLPPLMMADMHRSPSMPPLSCFQYWGKARPTDQGPDLHLLPYHCLDVAAVGRVYLNRSPGLRFWLAEQLGTADESAVCDWLTFWLALHDLGKFSISFQAQQVKLVERLQGEPPGTLGLAGVRHDSLGMHFWRDFLEPTAEEEGWFGIDPDVFEGIGFWVRAVTGHHGQPPQANVTHMNKHFRPQDVAAAREFVDAARVLLLPEQAARIAVTMRYIPKTSTDGPRSSSLVARPRQSHPSSFMTRNTKHG